MLPVYAEIKVTFDGMQVERVLAALAPLPPGIRRDVFFCEDVTRGMSAATPLLDIGVILRIRRAAEGKADSTVKLRPCRRSQFPERWLRSSDDEDPKFKLELDWAGERRVLSASCGGEPAASSIRKVSSGEESVGRLFNVEQERFLKECAVQRVRLSMLTLLPPVAGTRWGPWRPPALAYDGEIMLERWTIDTTLDFLEVSVRVPLGLAAHDDTALRAALRDLGLAPEQAETTKTARVLQCLIAQWQTSSS